MNIDFAVWKKVTAELFLTVEATVILRSVSSRRHCFFPELHLEAP